MFKKLKESVLDKIIDFLSTPSFGELGQAVEALKIAYLKSMMPILRSPGNWKRNHFLSALFLPFQQQKGTKGDKLKKP